MGGSNVYYLLFWQVRDVKIISDRNSRRSKGIGYVEFMSDETVPLVSIRKGYFNLRIPKDRVATHVAQYFIVSSLLNSHNFFMNLTSPICQNPPPNSMVKQANDYSAMWCI